MVSVLYELQFWRKGAFFDIYGSYETEAEARESFDIAAQYTEPDESLFIVKVTETSEILYC